MINTIPLAHGIAEDMLEAVLESFTMVQRGRTGIPAPQIRIPSLTECSRIPHRVPEDVGRPYVYCPPPFTPKLR
jgi:hypothetical protein